MLERTRLHAAVRAHLVLGGWGADGGLGGTVAASQVRGTPVMVPERSVSEPPASRLRLAGAARVEGPPAADVPGQSACAPPRRCLIQIFLRCAAGGRPGFRASMWWTPQMFRRSRENFQCSAFFAPLAGFPCNFSYRHYRARPTASRRPRPGCRRRGRIFPPYTSPPDGAAENCPAPRGAAPSQPS